MSFAFFRRSPPTRTSLPETITLDGRTVPLVVATSPRARRLTLRADPARALVQMTMPRGVSAARAGAFVASQHAWLAACVARWPAPRPLAPGATIPFMGRELTIVWNVAHDRTPRLDDDRLCIGGPAELVAGRGERWLKREALRVLTCDSAEFAVRIERSLPLVRVGDPKGRWGSCSARGVLAYSWRLIMAPDFVRRAVAAHEVAHLLHHNHGTDFHRLADSLAGGTAKSASRWLAANGAALHWVGRR